MNKEELISLLTTQVFGDERSIENKELVKRLKLHKDSLFHQDDVPKERMGQLHALGLQLIAKGIVQLVPKDSSKIGTDKFSDGDVYLRLGNGVNERGRRMPSYLINSNWEGLNMYGD